MSLVNYLKFWLLDDEQKKIIQENIEIPYQIYYDFPSSQNKEKYTINFWKENDNDDYIKFTLTNYSNGQYIKPNSIYKLPYNIKSNHKIQDPVAVVDPVDTNTNTTTNTNTNTNTGKGNIPVPPKPPVTGYQNIDLVYKGTILENIDSNIVNLEDYKEIQPKKKIVLEEPKNDIIDSCITQDIFLYIRQFSENILGVSLKNINENLKNENLSRLTFYPTFDEKEKRMLECFDTVRKTHEEKNGGESLNYKKSLEEFNKYKEIDFASVNTISIERYFTSKLLSSIPEIVGKGIKYENTEASNFVDNYMKNDYDKLSQITNQLIYNQEKKRLESKIIGYYRMYKVIILSRVYKDIKEIHTKVVFNEMKNKIRKSSDDLDFNETRRYIENLFNDNILQDHFKQILVKYLIKRNQIKKDPNVKVIGRKINLKQALIVDKTKISNSKIENILRELREQMKDIYDIKENINVFIGKSGDLEFKYILDTITDLKNFINEKLEYILYDKINIIEEFSQVLDSLEKIYL